MPCTYRAARNRTRVLYAQIADHLHHNNAKGQASQRVHGVVAFKKARHEGLRGMFPLRRDLGNLRRGRKHGDNHQYRQKR